jgi:Lrp/AsnC family leucine-responsive transcriptional regulator
MPDTIDSKVIVALQKDGRASWADLGAALGLSPPAAAERVRKLVDNGTIRGFTAWLDPNAAGFPVLAFVAVTLEAQGARAGFLAAVRGHDLIQECHHVAGDDDFLLKVRCRSLSELERLLADELKGRLGIARTRTTIVLGTAKETIALPVDVAAEERGSGSAATVRRAKRRTPGPRLPRRRPR